MLYVAVRIFLVRTFRGITRKNIEQVDFYNLHAITRVEEKKTPSNGP